MTANTPTRQARGKRLEPWSRKAERHGVAGRTLDRWAASGIIDPPTKINGRKFGDADEEPRRDPERQTAA